jgi:hypothetical protein
MLDEKEKFIQTYLLTEGWKQDDEEDYSSGEELADR